MTRFAFSFALALTFITAAFAQRPGNFSVVGPGGGGAYPPAPNYRMPLEMLSSSRHISLASYRGKVVVLNVFDRAE